MRILPLHWASGHHLSGLLQISQGSFGGSQICGLLQVMVGSTNDGEGDPALIWTSVLAPETQVELIPPSLVELAVSRLA